MKMGDANHSDSRINGNLKIFRKPAGMIQPGKGTLHNPSPGELLPLMRSDFFRKVNP